MKNKIFHNNIQMTSKQNLYALAGDLSSEIGRQRAGRWRGTTKQYWKKQVEMLQRNIKNRNNNYRQALQISENLRVPLNFPRIIEGTDNELWNREKRRMRKRAKDAEKRTIPVVRQRALPVLQDIVKGVAVGRIRQNRRAKLIERQLKVRAERVAVNNKINNLINNKKFQAVLNLIITDNEVLTQIQASNFWNSLRAFGRYTLLLNTDVGNPQWIPINETTKIFILDLLTQGVLERASSEYGSDILNAIVFETLTELKLGELRTSGVGRVINNRYGDFFPYINTTNLDLLKYQIFSQDNAYNEKVNNKREQCLLYTLCQCGVSKALINQIKMSFIVGSSIRKTDIKMISNTIKRNINICSIKPNGQVVKTKVKAIESKDEDIEIAMYANHYFKFEDTIYSKYFIDNYEELKDEDDKENIIKSLTKISKSGVSKKYLTRDKNKAKINSLLMVHKLNEQGHFKKLDLVKFDETSSHTELKDHIYLENIENEQQLLLCSKENPVKIIKKAPKIFYADCETYVNGENHELQLLGVVDDTCDIVNMYNVCDGVFQGKEVCKEQLLVYEFLNNLTRNGNQDALCYFHNLKYDYHVLEQYLNITNKCEKDNQIYNIKVSYKGKEIELRDSFKIIPFGLAKFQKEFSLNKKYSKGEAIAYNYYTIENNNKVIKIGDYSKLLSKKEQVIFKENMINEPSYDKENKTFNPLTYYKEYLRLDCLVLKKGIQKMDSLIKEITEGKMSVYECLTISSLTDRYMVKEGAYEGVYAIQGNLRAYVAEAVYGGRVCVNPKYERQVVEGKISDYDGVSLYPSAINRMSREMGLPKGSAKRLNLSDDWQQYTYSILTVKITKVNKTQQMPFIAHKSDMSIKYSNEPPPSSIIIDSITLQDYIKFHEIEYEIEDGVYWNDGGNPKMGSVIQRLFSARLKYKKSNVALANTIKLMLNSAYGKTIMKKTMSETKIIKTQSKKFNKVSKMWEIVYKSPFNDYVYNNFNTIKKYRQINKNNWEVERICADNSYNRGHIGCLVLSMSKRIMNEVFDVANTNQLPIYYTDTDSIHCNFEDVAKLEDEYKKEYGRVLNGKQLEQFHTDFNLDGAGDGEEIYATKSIFLGKKSYMDVLESKDKDGNIIHGTHIRLKGITEAGLEHSAKDYKDSYFGLYKDLAKGNTKRIVLNPFNPDENKHKVLFEFQNGRVRTRKEFAREVSFGVNKKK